MEKNQTIQDWAELVWKRRPTEEEEMDLMKQIFAIIRTELHCIPTYTLLGQFAVLRILPEGMDYVTFHLPLRYDFKMANFNDNTVIPPPESISEILWLWGYIISRYGLSNKAQFLLTESYSSYPRSHEEYERYLNDRYGYGCRFPFGLEIPLRSYNQMPFPHYRGQKFSTGADFPAKLLLLNEYCSRQPLCVEADINVYLVERSLIFPFFQPCWLSDYDAYGASELTKKAIESAIASRERRFTISNAKTIEGFPKIFNLE